MASTISIETEVMGERRRRMEERRGGEERRRGERNSGPFHAVCDASLLNGAAFL